jgi:TonB-dependent starch-binding outer membrane protein SusC
MSKNLFSKRKIFFKGKLFFVFYMLFNSAFAFANKAVAINNVSYFFQSKIGGKVISSTDNLPIPGVTVTIKGTTFSSITDIDGKFELPAKVGDVLVFSSIGFANQEIKISNLSNITVNLSEATQSLEEVVVVGYGTRKKATVTGSVSEIGGKDIVQSAQVNVTNSLAGRVSGVIANSRSGEPGTDDSNISIRGLATTGNTDVLVVVDGVPGQIGGLGRLSPQEIESVTVLKDASAAIYGSRAANGVILVTTKKGKKNSKTQVSYSFNQGLSSPTRLPDMADSSTYATIRNEIAYYNDTTKGLNQIYSQEEINKFKDGSDPINYPNTNWADEALKKVSLLSQHNLNIQGGSEKSSYFLSLGKISQEGIYKNGANQYNQYNVRTNIDTNISDRFKVGLSLSGRKEDRQYPTTSADNIFRSIYRAYPTVAAKYPNGLYSTGIENNNPLVQATSTAGLNENPTYVFNGLIRASYDFDFLEGLSVDGFYSNDISQSHTKNFNKPYTLYYYNKTTDTYDATVAGGGADEQATLSEEQYNQNMSVSNFKINFKRQFGDHNVDAFVGYEQSEKKTHTFGASRIHFPSTETPELSQGGAAASDQNNWGSSYNFTRQSYLSRIAYNFQEKYLLDLQMRVDGSSTFPEGSRFGFFPSISTGYVISKEEWFKDVSFFDDLKLRASWGRLGNDNVDQFQYYDNYSFNNRYVIGDVVTTGVDLTKLANPNITWEVAEKIDLGINAKWLKHFTTELIYFQQNRSKILASRNASIPATSGIVNPYDDGSDSYVSLVPDENIGKVKSHGIEATLGYDHKGEFSWGVTGNFTYAKNEIKFIDEAAGVLDYQKQTGRSINTYLLYNAIGIFRTQDQLDNTPHVQGATLGDLIYEDYNKDGKITADDQVRSKYGNIPQMTFGLNLGASYKNFDISLLFAGQAQVSQYVLSESGTVGNYYSSWADDRWSPTNPNGSHPRVSERASSAVSGGLYKNNFWLNDASFVRLKNVQLGYSLPSDVLEKYGVSSLRFYLSGSNLFTITKVKDYDPEGSSESGQFYPQQKIINFGLNIQF